MSALRVSGRAKLLLALLLALVFVWAMFHKLIQRSLSVHLLLGSNNPREELFEETVRQAGDPVSLLQSCWATGKVAHRALVAGFLKNNSASRPEWLTRAEPLLLACATDADASVRELGLAALDQVHSPHLFEAAQIQLDDLDPMVRRLGLDYLRKCAPAHAAPLLIHALDDPDLRNVATAEIGLMRLSGQDFGVRASLAMEPQENAAVGQGDSANVQAIRRGVEQRKLWWREHQKEYASVAGSAVSAAHLAFSSATRPPAPDFTLHDLAGRKVNLSDSKGKVVLVNFWATWCTACLKEMPDLIALQQKMGDQVAILGVALDGVPDEDGDVPGDDGEKRQKNHLSRQAVRTKVERAVKLRGINYPVLPDPKGSVGGQYNGGELPTTVIFDAEGRVRRRFIGERNLSVFQLMVAEAGKPLRMSQTGR